MVDIKTFFKTGNREDEFKRLVVGQMMEVPFGEKC